MIYNIIKRRIISEYIYNKRHAIPVMDLETLKKRANTKSKEECLNYMVDFYMNKIKWDIMVQIVRKCSKISDKNVISISKIKTICEEILTDSISQYLIDGKDAVYINEFVIVNIYNGGGKDYISLSPRIDFSK